MAVGLVDRSEVSGVCCPGGVGVAAVVGSMQSLGRGRFLRDAELLRFARRNLLPSSARLLWVFTLDEHFFACKVLAPDVPSAEEDPDLEVFLACDITPLKPLWLFVKEVRLSTLCKDQDESVSPRRRGEQQSLPQPQPRRRRKSTVVEFEAPPPEEETRKRGAAGASSSSSARPRRWGEEENEEEDEDEVIYMEVFRSWDRNFERWSAQDLWDYCRLQSRADPRLVNL